MLLHWELFSRLLMKHPFLRFLGQNSRGALTEVCQYAIAEARFHPGEEIFHRGAKAEGMLLLNIGRLQYFAGVEQRSLGEGMFVDVGQWLCEQCLWIPWTHQGRLVAHDQSLCLMLSSKQFGMIMENRPQELLWCRHYARLWLGHLRDTFRASNGDDVHDLFLSNDDLRSLVRRISGTIAAINPFHLRAQSDLSTHPSGHSVHTVSTEMKFNQNL
mmetsp:Transcript_43497/g.94709  ORF Transcript_43497/g.94709 Transcript_43497/m.94709 type:complete len:215 (+) Transcript_43497:2-646(+)